MASGQGWQVGLRSELCGEGPTRTHLLLPRPAGGAGAHRAPPSPHGGRQQAIGIPSIQSWRARWAEVGRSGQGGRAPRLHGAACPFPGQMRFVVVLGWGGGPASRGSDRKSVQQQVRDCVQRKSRYGTHSGSSAASA